MTILSIAAYVLWILSLSIMASATRTAWMRMEPETRAPVMGAWRLSLNVALPLPIVLAFAACMALRGATSPDAAQLRRHLLWPARHLAAVTPWCTWYG